LTKLAKLVLSEIGAAVATGRSELLRERRRPSKLGAPVVLLHVHPPGLRHEVEVATDSPLHASADHRLGVATLHALRLGVLRHVRFADPLSGERVADQDVSLGTCLLPGVSVDRLGELNLPVHRAYYVVETLLDAPRRNVEQRLTDLRVAVAIVASGWPHAVLHLILREVRL
jgi:hypothetical protein